MLPRLYKQMTMRNGSNGKGDTKTERIQTITEIQNLKDNKRGFLLSCLQRQINYCRFKGFSDQIPYQFIGAVIGFDCW